MNINGEGAGVICAGSSLYEGCELARTAGLAESFGSTFNEVPDERCVPELLAPAGSQDALYAAVTGGADAVYLGLGDFNARRGADNFTPETLEAACRYAHLRRANIYVTLNTVILPGELEAAKKTAYTALSCGADAIIVQDLGLASCIARDIPEARMHFSTQMNIHTRAGVEACAALGASRVTFARELSLDEICELTGIAHELGLQTESFAHGAICVCYSGQCFMSSAVGTRSANRGMCAQACRMPYELVRLDSKGAGADTSRDASRAGKSGRGGSDRARGGRGADKSARVAEKTSSDASYLLSPKDLCAAYELGKLCATGVDSLKIEGRMKSADYVYSVVSTYREMLDELGGLRGSDSLEGAQAATDALEYRASDSQIEKLGSVFSRGFSSAYLTSVRSNDMMSYTRPNNRGQLAGRVQSVDGQTFTIKPSLDLAAGDILEVWTRAGNFTCTVDTAALASFGSATAGAKSGKASKTGKNGKASQKGQKGRNSKGGYTLELATPSGAKSPSVGDRVFRVRSADAVFVSDALAPKVPVYGRVSLKIGEPLFVEFSAYGTDGELLGCESCTGDVVEPARSREVAKEDVYAHIDRLGQTSFELVDLQIDLDPGVGIGFSALHHIRQDALAALEDCLVAARTRESAAVARAKLCEGETKGRKRAKKNNEGEVVPNADALEVCALVANPQCARAARRTGAEVYVAAVNFARGTAQMCGAVCEDVAQAGYPSRAKIVLPVADHDAIEGTREAALGIDLRQYMSGAAAVVAQNLGQLANAATEGLPCEVGPNLPVTNVSAYELMASLGARCVWLSPEMTLAQVRDLLAGIRSADCQGAHGVGNTAIDKNNSEHGISCMPAAGIFVAGRLCLMTTEHCELMSAGPCNEDCSKCVRRRGRYALRDRKGYEFPVVSDRLGRSSIYNAVPLDIAHALPDLVRVGITRFMVDSTLMSPEETAQACGRVAKAIELYRKGEEPLPKSGNATTGHLFRQVD